MKKRGYKMYNLTVIEEYYQKISKNLGGWLHDEILEVTPGFLSKLKLTDYENPKNQDTNLTQYFHVIESLDKITLINDEFVVWIVPDITHEFSKTYTLVARNLPDQPHIELAYQTAGQYNNSKLILRVLEKLLFEIQENESFINQLEQQE